MDNTWLLRTAVVTEIMHKYCQSGRLTFCRLSQFFHRLRLESSRSIIGRRGAEREGGREGGGSGEREEGRER